MGCSGEPLLSSLCTTTEDVFWQGWVKGQARTSAALLVADQLLTCRVDVSHLSKLACSFSCVSIRLACSGTDMATIGFENARLSSSGAIRQALDILQWLGKLVLLRARGVDGASVLQRWNKIPTAYSQIGGQKRAALLNLLDFPPECVDLLLQHSGNNEKPAFMEDAFANKKLCVGR